MRALFVLIFNWIAVSAFAGEVVFERKIEVSDRAGFTLGDIAVFKNVPAATQAELANVAIADVSANGVRALLRAKKSEAAFADLKFVIPDAIEVKRVRGYSGAEFRRKVGNLLQAQCESCQFEFYSIRDEQVLIGSSWRIDSSSVKMHPSILVSLIDDSARTTWVPVQVKVFKKALVAKRTLLADEKLNADQFELKLSDVTNVKEAADNLEGLSSATARRYIGAGQVLSMTDVVRAHWVKRGQAVKLIIASGDFEITAAGTAEENGRAGDMIKVKSPETGKVLTAEVVAEGMVRVR